jgi:hypothetical protein
MLRPGYSRGDNRERGVETSEEAIACVENLNLQKENLTELSKETIAQYLNEEQLKSYKESGARILSITVFGEKPEKSGSIRIKMKECSGPGCC